MKNQMHPTDMTNCQWDCINDLLPPAKPDAPRITDICSMAHAAQCLAHCSFFIRCVIVQNVAYGAININEKRITIRCELYIITPDEYELYI